MKTMKEFAEEMKTIVRDHLPDEVHDDLIIDYVEVVKMNDQKLHGLTFRMPDCDTAPTFYIDDLYKAYSEGADLRYLASEMGERYSQTGNMPKPSAVDLCYDTVRDKLSVRLLDKKRNIEYLSNMPYVSVGHGLALIADINMEQDKEGDWRIAVNNNVLASLGVDKETLFSDAISCAEVREPALLVDMSNALFSPERVNLLERDEPLEPEDIGGMYVLSNVSGFFGAAVLFYPDVKEKAAELLRGDYYILPSSCHEFILVPDTIGLDASSLCDMVKKANTSVVDEKDILSYDVYHYSRKRGLERISPPSATAA